MSSPGEYPLFKARRLAVDLETLDVLAGLKENPQSAPFLSPDRVLGWTPCPLRNCKIFDFFFFFRFPFCFYMTVSLIRGALAIISIVMVGISLRKS